MKLGDPVQCLLLECRSLPSDSSLTLPLEVRHAALQCLDELAQLADQLGSIGDRLLLICDYRHGFAFQGISPQSCKTTLKSELLILRGSSPLYSMKPSFLNLFRKKFTRERVVPTIFASVSCETFGTTRTGLSCFP
jgi:hypothetical protein